LTIIAILSGITTFLIWYMTGQSLDFAMERMVTVIRNLLSSCFRFSSSSGRGKINGIICSKRVTHKNRTAFENSRKITTVVFDKTGTLTIGKFEVSKLSLKNNLDENEIIRLAATLETKIRTSNRNGYYSKSERLIHFYS
jgi:Cu2+-exporting ATPase